MQPSNPEWVKYAKVGDKVVCVKDGPWQARDGDEERPGLPMHGMVVTIRQLMPDDDGLIFLQLEDFRFLDLFLAAHFKPLDPRPTDISVFTAMLDRVPA